MCDTIVVVRPEGVLWAKNSDRDPNEAQLLEWLPRQSHSPGDLLRCSWIEIPQVSETNAILISRPFWMWGAEMGTNEHGVTIGNEAVFTRQKHAETGLTGMDLLRLALERSDSARAAVDVIIELLEKHGQGGGCGYEKPSFTYHNSFLVADPKEAYVLETAGRLTAVEHIEEGARSISNGLTISGFAEGESDRLMSWGARCELRRAHTEKLAGDATSAADLTTILRSHGEESEEPAYELLFGGMKAPCMHGGGLVAASQTTASWVADLRADDIRHWATATAAPCTSLFKPIEIDEPLELGQPTGETDPNSLFWRHERLQRRVMTNPLELLPLFAPERDEAEARWMDRRPTPREAFAEGDRLLARWMDLVAGHQVPDVRPWWVRRYWNTRNRQAGVDLGSR